MTLLERIEHLKKLVEAEARGEEIQYWSEYSGKWVESGALRNNDTSCLTKPEAYRIKPKSAVRPWNRPEDVPGPVCWVRSIGVTDQVLMITGMSKSTFCISTKGIRDWSEIEDYEHSTDRKTWLPCTVTK